MDYIEDCSDERLKGSCPQCGARLDEENRSVDHVPSKCLLSRSEGPLNDEYPARLPVVPTCHRCNAGFSRDEEYMHLFLHCVLVGSTDPKRHADSRVRRALSRHVGVRESIERSKRVRYDGVDAEVVWTPVQEHVDRVVLKNARGHVFYEFGQPMLEEPDGVWTRPLMAMTEEEREAFGDAGAAGISGWPELGCRMMTRVLTRQDVRDGWVVVQDGVYRYRVEQAAAGVLVRSVLREYLATAVYWSGE